MVGDAQQSGTARNGRETTHTTMTTSDLLASVAESPPFTQVVEALRDGVGPLRLHGLGGSLRAFFLAGLRKKLDPGACLARPLVAVAATTDEAEKLRDDLETLLGTAQVRYFPAWEMAPYEERSPHLDVTGLRIEALHSLLKRERAVVVTTIRALTYPAIPMDVLESHTRELRPGDGSGVHDLAEHLTSMGFERLPMVEGVGQFSVRGGIVDLYGFGSPDPHRLEFLGDRIESIRAFDLSTQRSTGPRERVLLLPCREVVLDPRSAEDYLTGVGLVELEVGAPLGWLRERVEARMDFEGIEHYLGVFHGRWTGLLDYLSPDAMVFWDDPEGIEAEAQHVVSELARLFDAQREDAARTSQTPVPPQYLHLRFSSVEERLSRMRVLRHLSLKSGEPEPIAFGGTTARRYEGDLNVLRADLSALTRKHQVAVLCESKGQAARLEELLGEVGLFLDIGVGSLHEGFVFDAGRAALLNDHEIFGRYKRRRRYREFKDGVPLASYTALSKGDFVVHVDYGIGRYLGLERLVIDDVARDCLHLGYRDDDKVYVPVEQLDRVQKYSSEEGRVPILSKLGGTGWEKIKARAKKAALGMARELISLYAERQSRPGVAFSPDSHLQKEMEAGFIYQETADQLKAVQEVKRDLERPVAMDRLVCGDVGYGKTEVAIRAACKVVNDGRQAAVLAPTTILAQQHYMTFRERLAGLPVDVDVLSRFRTAKEQKEIVDRIRHGAVDVVIGTHRLLSRDVQFKDLGLLVIDEEQRFGVKHKEQFKRMRRMVDVLALTATPIPRTLHMSLMGARDMSVINTPPKDRLPVYTEILPFNEERIAEAILQEVHRGGQVFFVHNRVESINTMFQFLKELLPEVRFAVGHGQMPERQLERVMLDFLDRKFDCLVASMIVESGLDIPNVNTILINRADRLGLAQLYQLRGRVGRSHLRAYSYLLTPPWRTLSKEAKRRLRAIEEFSDLGSGFKVAMRDLEIRGAGNILGMEQHGFILDVGFDLYCRLLEEAVAELKGGEEAWQPAVEPKLEIRVSAFVPTEYVEDVEQKMGIYQRLAEAKGTLEILQLEEETRDRFGRMPPEAEALFLSAHLKVAAQQLGLAAVSVDDDRMRLILPPDRAVTRKDVERWVAQSPMPLEFSFREGVSIEARLEGIDRLRRLASAKNVLQALV